MAVKTNAWERERRYLVLVTSAGARRSDAMQRGKRDRKYVVIANALALFVSLPDSR